MIWKLGYRNLWRNKRRTALTMTAMATATALVILILGVQEGMLWDMIEGATEMYHGHAQVTAPGYLEDNAQHLTLSDPSLADRLRADPEVKGVSGRLHGFAFVTYGQGEDSESKAAELLGIDAVHEPTVTRLHTCVTEGRFLQAQDVTAVVLGAGLARTLGARIGGEVAALGQGVDGSMAQGLFTVVGIIDSGDPVRDSMLAVVPLVTLGDFLVLPGQVHEWSVALHRVLDAPLWTTAQQAKLGLTVRPWQEVLPFIAQYLEMWSTFQIIFTAIFYFAVILVTANTLSMSFFERIREFAVMGALGLSPGWLMLLIVSEGFMLALLAALIGGAVGSAGSFWLFHHYIDLGGDAVSFAGTAFQPRLRSYPTVGNILMPISMMLSVGVLIAMIPAMRLRRQRPVDSLREV